MEKNGHPSLNLTQECRQASEVVEVPVTQDNGLDIIEIRADFTQHDSHAPGKGPGIMEQACS